MDEGFIHKRQSLESTNNRMVLGIRDSGYSFELTLWLTHLTREAQSAAVRRRESRNVWNTITTYTLQGWVMAIVY